MTVGREIFPNGIKRPGSVAGPCAGDCNHDACREMRDHASSDCTNCLEAIGYNRPFICEAGRISTCGDCLDRQADQLHQRDDLDGIRAT